MKTGILVALAVVAVASLGIVVAATSAHPTTQATGTMGGSYGGGMVNGGYGGMMGGQYRGGMMGNGGSCPYSGSYQYCQQYMNQNNYTNGECPMMG